MTSTAPTGLSLEARLGAVPRPVPVMSRDEMAQLTLRQREILEELTELFANGFSHLTMADIARALGCSLRTLYGIAPSRDLLVLAACDASLWQAGRAARVAVGEADQVEPLEAIRRYLLAATRAVSATTPAFVADLATVPGGAQLNAAHSDYLVAITKELLDAAVEQGHIAPVDTLVIAHAMAGISSIFIRPGIIETLPGTPKDAADLIADTILRGLTAPLRPTPESS